MVGRRTVRYRPITMGSIISEKVMGSGSMRLKSDILENFVWLVCGSFDLRYRVSDPKIM